jgi:hypothetical protein
MNILGHIIVGIEILLLLGGVGYLIYEEITMEDNRWGA